MSDPTEALATALLRLDDENPGIIAKFGEYIALDDAAAASSAGYILAALPEGTHLFTVDSLAAALAESSVYDMWDEDDGRYSDKDYATAIIQAAKEAERIEPWGPTDNIFPGIIEEEAER